MHYNVTLRPLAGEIAYQDDIKSGRISTLEQLPTVHEWKYWRLVRNGYPYSIAFKQHDMLVIKRQVGERFCLTRAERKEFEQILKEFVYEYYHLWFENVPARRTAPHLYHVHLVRYHDCRDDMRL